MPGGIVGGVCWFESRETVTGEKKGEREQFFFRFFGMSRPGPQVCSSYFR
jgi:hypothetical protein